jgi:DNA-binding NarL/FixJ family response regulator
MDPHPPNSAPVRVLVADDSEIYRAGLVRAIRASEGLELVAAVTGGTDAVGAAADLCPAVAVLDYRMPDLDGLSAAVEIRAADPGCRILLISAFAEQLVDRLEQEGDGPCHAAFDAILDKASSRRDIVERIRALARVPSGD